MPKTSARAAGRVRTARHRRGQKDAGFRPVQFLIHDLAKSEQIDEITRQALVVADSRCATLDRLSAIACFGQQPWLRVLARAAR